MKACNNFVLLLLTILLFLSGCTKKQELQTDVERAGEVFLMSIFTTNQNGRWDTYQTADFSTIEAGSMVIEQYYSSFANICTESGLSSIVSNRLPYTYDELAWKYDCTIEPEEITFDIRENTAEFTVELSVIREEEVLGKVEQNGQLQLVQNGEEYFIDSAWIANLDDLKIFLESL